MTTPIRTPAEALEAAAQWVIAQVKTSDDVYVAQGIAHGIRALAARIPPLPADVAGLVDRIRKVDQIARDIHEVGPELPSIGLDVIAVIEAQAARIASLEARIAAADRLAADIAPVADLVAGSGIDFKRKYPKLNAVLDKSRQDEWHDIIGWIVADALTAYLATKEPK